MFLFLTILGCISFICYPREVSISFPILELEKLLKLDNGNEISFDLINRMITITTLWPFAITNDNYLPLYADLNSVDLYYPGVEGFEGVHIARATAETIIMPAKSKEIVNWIEVDARVTPIMSDGLRMNTRFTDDCITPCRFVLPKDCAATTTIFADIVLHLDDDQFNQKFTNAVGSVELEVAVELSCTLFFPKGGDE